MRHQRLIHILTLILFQLIIAVSVCAESANTTDANSPCVAQSSECKKVGAWEFSLALGLGGRSNPIADGSDQPIVLVPSFSWYGKRFFIDTFEAGFTFVDEEQHMLNAIVQPGFDQVYFDEFGFGNFALGENFSAGGILADSGVSSGMDASPVTGPDSEQGGKDRQDAENPEPIITELNDRKIALLGGLEYSYFSGPWQIHLAALNDISKVHHGHELRLAASYYRQYNKNQFAISGGLAWQNENLLDYYYGLDRNEVRRSDFVYEAKSGLSSFIKMSWSKKLSERWVLVSALHFRQFDNELKNSPLIEESVVTTAFIGGRYHF